ncbi:MAG: hypothetical protein U0L98_03500 [Clostridia bacterium]|nr:hypothetical protein [Clostridia bacterium]
MYERNAIVLERYFEKIFGLSKDNNLKTNFEYYAQIIETIYEYQKIVDEEESAIEKFDEIAEEIEAIQKKQIKLHDINIELENQRNQYFNDLGENPSTLDNKLKKIEDKLDNNNDELKELRNKYVKAIVLFIERQKERNKFARTRRTAEVNYRNQINKLIKLFEDINIDDVKKIQIFLHTENEKIEKEIVELLSKNGKSEKVPFFSKVLENAAKERTIIAKIEANLYLNIYDKTKKILTEIENETIKLGKTEKLARDTEVKLAFLEAEKEYIVTFLDNERMTVINGKKTHERLMEDACKNFEKDIEQIGNLYELVLRETTNKSTKKAYKELYNKDYLRKIEEKEKDFEEEVTNVKVNIGTVINSNYWRIEGIKNIYKVFQEEISEKFNKDLSEFRIEEPDEIEQKTKINFEYEDDEENDEFFDDEFENSEDVDNFEDEEDDYEDDEYSDDDDYDYEDDSDDDYEDEDEDDDDYEDDLDEEDEYGDYDDDYEDDFDDEDEYDDYEEEKNNNETVKKEEIILQEEEDLTEEKIDELIRNSRKKNKKKTSKKTNKNKENKEDNDSKSLFGKLFKK